MQKRTDPWRPLLVVMSLTRAWVDVRKDRLEGDERSAFLRRWNVGWLLVEVLVFIGLWVSTQNIPELRSKLWPFSPILLVAVWRINEIIYAFYRDSMDRLGGATRSSTLSDAVRLQMLMRSYVSLLLCFAVLYYFLPADPTFVSKVATLGDALYLSAAVQTSLGQEGLEINSLAHRILSIYQVIAGLTLLVLAVATYMSSSFAPREGDA